MGDYPAFSTDTKNKASGHVDVGWFSEVMKRISFGALSKVATDYKYLDWKVNDIRWPTKLQRHL
jgi:hypothetical protein